METDQNQNTGNGSGRHSSTDASDTSQDQNNNGTIGRENGEENEGSGSFKNIGKDKEHPVNERGIAENQEDHSLRDEDDNKRSSGYAPHEDDPNLPNIPSNYPKSGYNHVDNPRGTSKEDLDDEPLDLDDENAEDDYDPFDADGSRL